MLISFIWNEVVIKHHITAFVQQQRPSRNQRQSTNTESKQQEKKFQDDFLAICRDLYTAEGHQTAAYPQSSDGIPYTEGEWHKN